MFLEVFNIKDTNGRKEVYNERMEQLNKLTVINEIDDLLETYCEGCFIKRELKINGGKTMAHRFCINSCTVGDQLQFLGQELNKVKTK